MAVVEGRRLAFERSQNIALLSLLTQNPTSPETNTCTSSVPRGKKGRRGRVLSFERESHLTEALAFISGISDNSDHVVAVCLEELPGDGGLQVLVAVNRSTYANPSDKRFLDRIQSGLGAVFRVLARARSGKYTSYSLGQHPLLNLTQRVTPPSRSRRLMPSSISVGIAYSHALDHRETMFGVPGPSVSFHFQVPSWRVSFPQSAATRSTTLVYSQTSTRSYTKSRAC